MAVRWTSKIFLWSLLVVISLQPSYIHPDEHFQSLEVLSQRFFGSGGAVAWEFTKENAARSIVPLFIFYGPVFWVCKVCGVQSSSVVLSLIRLWNLGLYFLVLVVTVPGFSDGNLQIWSTLAYTTWTFQSHSFSNSLETLILLLVLHQMKKIRNFDTVNFKQSFMTGFLIALGFFTRITFFSFILIPCMTLAFKFYKRHIRQLLTLIITFAVSCMIFVAIDTQSYGSVHWICAPWNNLQYNLDEKNLSLHGLHPRYTHMLINLPQLVGPLVVFLPRLQFRNLYDQAFISGLVCLSFFKHQELRFLLPLSTLLCISVSRIPIASMKKWIIYSCYMFNFVFMLIMGVGHQAGVIRALQHFCTRDAQGIGIHLWWKTYSPPTWMYMNKNLKSTTISDISASTIDYTQTHNYSVDLQGKNLIFLNATLSKFLTDNDSVTLIMPNSVRDSLSILSDQYTFHVTYHTYWHLDLDHFEPPNLQTFMPGLAAYEVSLNSNK